MRGLRFFPQVLNLGLYDYFLFIEPVWYRFRSIYYSFRSLFWVIVISDILDVLIVDFCTSILVLASLCIVITCSISMVSKIQQLKSCYFLVFTFLFVFFWIKKQLSILSWYNLVNCAHYWWNLLKQFSTIIFKWKLFDYFISRKHNLILENTYRYF